MSFKIKVGRLFKESPAVFIAPILTFTLCLGLGLFGVLYGAHLAENDLRERAHANGEACTSGILSEVQTIFAPSMTLASLVKATPFKPEWEQSWSASGVHAVRQLPPVLSDAFETVWVAPQGTTDGSISNINGKWTVGNDSSGVNILKMDGNVANLVQQSVGSLDALYLANPERLKQLTGSSEFPHAEGVDHLNTVFFLEGPHLPILSQQRQPVMLTAGTLIFMPADSADETWGFQNEDCGASCYNATTGLKLWGIVSANVNMERLLPRTPLSQLKNAGFRWSLWRQTTPLESLFNAQNYVRPHVIASSKFFNTKEPASSPAAWEPVWARFTATNGPLASDNLNKPLRFRIPLQHNAWELLIEPESGSWTPVWRDGLIALVVVGSVLVSLGLFAILWSRAHNQMILKALVPHNVIKELWNNEGMWGQDVDPNWLDYGSPAAKMLELATSLLEGQLPSTQDVLIVRTAILQGCDLYQPVGGGMEEKLAALDDDVTLGLLQQLGERKSFVDRRRLKNSTDVRGPGWGNGDAILEEEAEGEAIVSVEVQLPDLHSTLKALMTAGSSATPKPAYTREFSFTSFDVAVTEGAAQEQHAANGPRPASGQTGAYGGGGGGTGGSGDLTTQHSCTTREIDVVPESGECPNDDGSGPHIFRSATRPSAALSAAQHNGFMSRLLPFMARSQASLPKTDDHDTPHDPATSGPLQNDRLSVSASPSMVIRTRRGSQIDDGDDARVSPRGANAKSRRASAFAVFGKFNLHREKSMGEMHLTTASTLGRSGYNMHQTACTGSQCNTHSQNSAVVTQDDIDPTPASGGHGIRKSCDRGPASSNSVRSGPLPYSAVALVVSRQAKLNRSLPRQSSLIRIQAQAAAVEGADGAGDRDGGDAPAPPAAGSRLSVSAAPAVGGSQSRGGDAGVAGAVPTALAGRSSGQLATLRSALGPPPPVLEEVEKMLATASDSWMFDMFALAEATRGHPLSTLGYFLLAHETRLVSTLRLSPTMLARFLRNIEAGYKPHPYHNATHAADVLQALHMIIAYSGLVPNYVDPLTHLAMLLVAAVHDFGHVGRTNDFLIASAHPLAMRYNDRSPMENYHCAASLTLMAESDFLPKSMPKTDRERLRRTIIDIVLATDMKQHLSLTSHFNTVHRINPNKLADQSIVVGPGTSASAAPGSGTGNTTPLGTVHNLPSLAMGSRNSILFNGSRASNKPGSEGVALSTISNMLCSANKNFEDIQGSRHSVESIFGSNPHTMNSLDSSDSMPPVAPMATPRVPLDEAERLLTLQIAMKCADMGHMAESLEVHKKWVASLEEEFFIQGDAEKQLRLPVSPLYDRDKPGISKSQIGFFEFVVFPLYRSFMTVFPGCRPMMAGVDANFMYWKDLSPPAPPAAPTPQPPKEANPGPPPLHTISLANSHQDRNSSKLQPSQSLVSLKKWGAAKEAAKVSGSGNGDGRASASGAFLSSRTSWQPDVEGGGPGSGGAASSISKSGKLFRTRSSDELRHMSHNQLQPGGSAWRRVLGGAGRMKPKSSGEGSGDQARDR